MPARYTADEVTTARAVLTNMGLDPDTMPMHDWIRERCLDVDVIPVPLLRPLPGFPFGQPFTWCGSSPAFAYLMPVRPVSDGSPLYHRAPVAALYLVVDDGAVTVVMGS